MTTAPYLTLLLCGRVLYDLGQAIAPATSASTGLPLGSLLLGVSMIAAVVLWGLCRGVGSWGPSHRVWFALILALWLYLVGLEVARGAPQAVSFFVPITIVLVWLKRPSNSDAWQASDALAWAVAGAAAVVLVLEVVGIIPSWYSRMMEADPAFATLAQFDRDTHWLPLRSLLGLEGRWGGFMADPNLIGPLAALLMVYAFARPGLRRVVFAGMGATMLLLADSRASYAAAAVGLTMLLLLPGWGVPLHRVTAAKGVALTVALAAAVRVLADVAASPGGAVTMTGRTGMWPDFLALWQESPIVGVGTARIVEAVAQGEVPPWSYHGHNQHIDMLVRYGLIGLLLSLAVLGVALAIAVAGAARGLGLGVALMAALAVITVANVTIDWRNPGETFSVILVAVLLSATQSRTAGAKGPA